MVQFTPQTVYSSQPVYTAQDIQAQEKAKYDKQMEAYNAALAAERSSKASQQAQQDKAAQQLVDYLSVNPLQWDTTAYMYDPVSTGLNRVFIDNGKPGLGDALYYMTPSSAVGNVQGGAYVPTLDEAKALLAASGNYTGSSPRPGETPQETIQRIYGTGLSDQLTNYLVAQNVYQQPGTIGDLKAVDAYHGRQADNAPLLGAFVGTGTDPLKGLLSQAGVSTTSFAPSAKSYSAAPSMPSSWQPAASAINQQSVANSDLYTDAYNKITLGGNYGGGVINDAYSQPFANVVGAPDSSWAMASNPLAAMPWASASWNTPSYGGPMSQQSASAYSTGAAASAGGLGGLGGAGPWGARNPWSPS